MNRDLENAITNGKQESEIEETIKLVEKQDSDTRKIMTKGLIDGTHELKDMAIDLDTGNEIKMFEKKPEWISATKIRIGGKIYSISPFELSWFSYNQNDFVVLWENVHPDPRERATLPVIRHNIAQVVMIPHRFYTPWVKYVGNPAQAQLKFIEMNYEYLQKHFKIENFTEKKRRS